jgi:hypothetical protein
MRMKNFGMEVIIILMYWKRRMTNIKKMSSLNFAINSKMNMDPNLETIISA